jgi:DNA polymerase III subunit delta
MPVLSQERLARQLHEGATGGVFLLSGEEDHLKDAMAREIVASHLDPATRDFNLDEVRGPEVTAETLGSLIGTPPMMADWRVVVVRQAQGLAASAAARSILEETAQRPPPGLVLVLVADTGGSKAKIWNTLKQKATAVEFPRLSDADMPGWLMGWAEDAGLQLEVAAARAVAAAIGPDLATAVREMEKLRDYVGDRIRITRADVEAVVGAIPRQDRWEWIDAVAERRLDHARAALPILLDMGETGVGLVIALGAQFLRIALFDAGGRPALERALPPNQKWLARKVEPQAGAWSTEEIRAALGHLRRADRLLKSAPLSELQVMEELLLRLQHGAPVSV